MPAISWCEKVKEKFKIEPRDVRPLYIPFRVTLNPDESKALQYDLPPNYAYSWEALTYYSDGTFDIQIKDLSVSDFLMPEPVPIETIAGIGMMPAFLPCPYLFMPNSGFEVILKNTSGAINNIAVVFWGYKLIL